jgi:hypothetical protein
MRTGWSTALAQRLQRVDHDADLVVEIVAIQGEHVVRTAEAWAEVDDMEGLEAAIPYGLTLAPTSAPVVRWDESDDVTPAIAPLATSSAELATVAMLRRVGPGAVQVRKVSAHLVPRLNPEEAMEVVTWRLELHRLDAITGVGDFARVATTVLAWAETPAHGPATGPVVFDFGAPVTVLVAAPTDADDDGRFAHASAWLVLVPRKGDGSPAANAGWATSAEPYVEEEPPVELSSYTVWYDAGTWAPETSGPLPRVQVYAGSYLPAVASFATAGENLITLPSAPEEDVELVLQGEAPGGSVLAGEISADGVTWYPYRDGDLVGVDNTPAGGCNLVALATAPYPAAYRMRATLSPSGDGLTAPTVWELGARAVETAILDGTTSVSGGGQAVDPDRLSSEIAETVIQVVRDGERDGRDQISELLKRYPIGRVVAVRVWVASRGLPQSSWMLQDALLLDDVAPAPSHVVLTCLSPLGLLRNAAVPAPEVDEGGVVTREPKVYANALLQDVWADLLGGQAAVPARYLGAGIPGTNTARASRILTDANAKDELDAVAHLAGGVALSSQGRIRYADVYGDGPPVEIWPMEELRVASVEPGLRARRPEVYVPWDYVDELGRYKGEVRNFDAASLAALGAAMLDPPTRVDDGIARWIDTLALANTVGGRITSSLGQGMLTAQVAPHYPHPHLEVGDRVAVEVEGFVGWSPLEEAGIGGRVWLLGTIVAADTWGLEFRIWCTRGYVDVLPAEWTVMVTPAAASVAVGAQRQLVSAVANLWGQRTDPPLVWTSSAPAVATVDAGGRVTGVAAGVATITATGPGGAAAGAVVTVTA